MAPLTEGWHPVLRALVLTLVVVPVAVYLVLPRLFAGYGALLRRRNSRTDRRARLRLLNFMRPGGAYRGSATFPINSGRPVPTCTIW